MEDVIDVHAHVLPGVDDGARDMDEALFLLCAAAAQGVTAVIATPHHTGQADPKRLIELTARIEEEMRESFQGFRLYPGQEIYFHEEIAEYLKKGKLLTLAGSRYVLVEFGTKVSYQSLYRGIRTLILAGYRPVLAHMERYGCLREEENLSKLSDCGCLLQMNYGSLQGRAFSREVRWCRRQVLEGRIHLFGTDMHRLDYRPPEIDGAMVWLEKNVEKRLLKEITRENPLHIINNEGIL